MDHRVGVSSSLVVLFSRFSLRTLPFTLLLFTIILFFTVWVIFCIFFFLDSDSYFFFFTFIFLVLCSHFCILISFSCFLELFFALRFSWPDSYPFHMAIEDYLVGGFGCLLR